MTGRFSLWAMVALCALSLSACGAAAVEEPTQTMDMGSHTLHPTADAATLAMPYDLLFIDGMMMHHLAAVDMANAALQSATSPDIKSLAEQIVTAQAAEVTQLRDWRAAWYPDAPMTSGTGTDMGAMEVSTDEAIPYDIRWINAMITHHKGAISMAEDAMKQAEHAELKTLATAVIAAQTSEVTLMQGWLPK